MTISFIRQKAEHLFNMHPSPKATEFRVRYLALQLYQETKYKQVNIKELKQRHEKLRKQLGNKVYRDLNQEVIKTMRARNRALSHMERLVCNSDGSIDTSKEGTIEARSILFHTGLIQAYMRVGCCKDPVKLSYEQWIDLLIEARLNNDMFELWESNNLTRRGSPISTIM